MSIFRYNQNTVKKAAFMRGSLTVAKMTHGAFGKKAPHVHGNIGAESLFPFSTFYFGNKS